MLYVVVASVLAAVTFIALRALGNKKIGFSNLTAFFLGLIAATVYFGIWVFGFYKVFLERFDTETIIIGALVAAVVIAFVALAMQSKSEERGWKTFAETFFGIIVATVVLSLLGWFIYTLFLPRK
jgi:hypothetical protein